VCVCVCVCVTITETCSRLVGADAQVARQASGNDLQVVVERWAIEKRLATLRKRRQDETATSAARREITGGVHLQSRRLTRHAIATVEALNNGTTITAEYKAART